ncbi:hypothetical protein UY3_13203 [Chelonia mydas]|uniref:Uncharacterized protein n=1 Tax=Chelonia mydas TaxID=8469 RepID=M7B2J1_CHEMY|nr:hypothetical protein UY3_13203 [Chelonia mydas]
MTPVRNPAPKALPTPMPPPPAPTRSSAPTVRPQTAPTAATKADRNTKALAQFLRQRDIAVSSDLDLLAASRAQRSAVPQDTQAAYLSPPAVPLTGNCLSIYINESWWGFAAGFVVLTKLVSNLTSVKPVKLPCIDAARERHGFEVPLCAQKDRQVLLYPNSLGKQLSVARVTVAERTMGCDPRRHTERPPHRSGRRPPASPVRPCNARQLPGGASGTAALQTCGKQPPSCTARVPVQGDSLQLRFKATLLTHSSGDAAGGRWGEPRWAACEKREKRELAEHKQLQAE